MNGGMVRESNADLYKMIPRIRFIINFWPPGQIDRPMQFCCTQKVNKIENHKYGGMVRIFHLMINWFSWLVYMLYYVKWPVEFDFLINFNRQEKLTESITDRLTFVDSLAYCWKLQIWWHGKEILPFDFLIILLALLCKTTRRIKLSNKY